MPAVFQRAAGAASTLGAVLLWAFAPKCPLCVAGWLAAAGIGAEHAAFLAPLLRPLAPVLLTAAVVSSVVGLARSRKRCCSGVSANVPRW